MSDDHNPTLPIDEAFLRSAGFRWHELDRQPTKHWLLWLGDATRQGSGFQSFEDLGVELAENFRNEGTYEAPKLVSTGWFCWLRADYAGRYSRFIHIRQLKLRHELISLCEGVTGLPWNAANHFSGCMLTTEQAHRRRVDDERLDRRMLRDGRPWAEIEKDASRGRALPEHMNDSITKGSSK